MNVDLVIAYNIIKTNPKELLIKLAEHQKNHNKEHYYKIRSQQELCCPIENSARFIYLLKTCFNGLCRVNKNNYFNAPRGSYKNPTIVDHDNIMSVNVALKNTEIKYQYFTKIELEKGDFVYFDPPYHPTTDTSFTKYVNNGFSEKDQIRLRDFILKLDNKGVNIMLSNSDTDFINAIYKKDFNIVKIPAPRVVNCKADKRKPVLEVLITNYS